jgi:hypothetical protein
MSNTKGTRRVLLDKKSRALPFCLGLWLGPPTLGVPTLEIA